MVQVQGTLTDAQGNVYPTARARPVTFTSPLNPGTSIDTDASGNYSVALLADQNFTASATAYAARRRRVHAASTACPSAPSTPARPTTSPCPPPS